METNINPQEMGENFEKKVRHIEDEIKHEKAEIKHLEEDVLHEKKEVDNLEKELKELEKLHHEDITLLVNSSPKKWDKNEISYEEVVELAFPKHTHNADVVYTITYSNGPERKPSGSLAAGDKVCVKNKMNFNVTPTNRS
jgi:predicted RNase H-like nuclease (RuvC/YqgF family)